MKRLFSSSLTPLSKQGVRVALLTVALVFGIAYTPDAHAAGVASAGPDTAVVEMITQRARSVLVRDISGPLQLPRCYNTTPGHITTIRGLEGEIAFTGYSNRNCSGALLCRIIVNIPPRGQVIIRLC